MFDIFVDWAKNAKNFLYLQTCVATAASGIEHSPI